MKRYSLSRDDTADKLDHTVRDAFCASVFSSSAMVYEQVAI
jgi:hypothetical protein